MPNSFDYMTEREVHETLNRVSKDLDNLANDFAKKLYPIHNLLEARTAADAAHHDYTEVINDPS